MVDPCRCHAICRSNRPQGTPIGTSAGVVHPSDFARSTWSRTRGPRDLVRHQTIKCGCFSTFAGLGRAALGTFGRRANGVSRPLVEVASKAVVRAESRISYFSYFTVRQLVKYSVHKALRARHNSLRANHLLSNSQRSTVALVILDSKVLPLNPPCSPRRGKAGNLYCSRFP
jgi:hypothetical protein